MRSIASLILKIIYGGIIMAIAKYKQISLVELKEIVKNNTSFSEVMRQLGYQSFTSQQSALKQYLDDNNIDYSHFKGHAWNKTEIPLSDDNDFGVVNKRTIREILLKERPYKCEKCGLTDWLGEPISLQVHHIDGNSNHNTRNNLMLLCPNCHSQTDNWCHKNVNRHTNIDDNIFLEALKNNDSICAACRELGITPNQNAYIRARKLLNI